MHSARIPLKRWRIIPSLHQERSYFLFLFDAANKMIYSFEIHTYVFKKYLWKVSLKILKNWFERDRIFTRIKQEFESLTIRKRNVFHFINTIKSKRATDVLKYPTKFTEMEKSKLTRCRIGWTMDSMTRVHLYVARLLICSGRFSKKIVLRLSLNRSLASFTLIDLAAFIFFQETSRNRLVYFYNRSSTFYFIFSSTKKRNNNCVHDFRIVWE